MIKDLDMGVREERQCQRRRWNDRTEAKGNEGGGEGWERRKRGGREFSLEDFALLDLKVKWPRAKECRQPVEAGKGREQISSRERMLPC